jgi:hypothetical protein
MIFKALRKRIKRWWNGPTNVSALDCIPYMTEKQMYEVIDLAGPAGTSMEVLDAYIVFRNEGLDPDEAKQAALREWDL